MQCLTVCEILSMSDFFIVRGGSRAEWRTDGVGRCDRSLSARLSMSIVVGAGMLWAIGMHVGIPAHPMEAATPPSFLARIAWYLRIRAIFAMYEPRMDEPYTPYSPSCTLHNPGPESYSTSHTRASNRSDNSSQLSCTHHTVPLHPGYICHV
jgi:hypothetical protein